MTPPSSDANDDAAPKAPGRDEVVSRWVVRLFLVLAFGLAFGIEGMTLIRSYFGSGGDRVQSHTSTPGTAGDGPGESAPALRVGADLLPETAVQERVEQMIRRARPSGPWTFHLEVAIDNDTNASYRLALSDLRTEDGTVFDDVYDTECLPGESKQLVATWPIGANARPVALTAEAELQLSGDSIRTVRRRVSFGHVPVQMER